MTFKGSSDIPLSHGGSPSARSDAGPAFAAHAAAMTSAAEDAQAAFSKYDRNRSGGITVEELRALLKDMGLLEGMAPQEAASWVVAQFAMAGAACRQQGPPCLVSCAFLAHRTVWQTSPWWRPACRSEEQGRQARPPGVHQLLPEGACPVAAIYPMPSRPALRYN
jgi:hypothetical protein